MTHPIIIVGAGLGGLSAALAVRQAGYEVVVLERAASFLPTAGAGITITAPGMASLTALGLEAEVLAASAAAPVTPMIHYQTGKVFHTRAVPNLDAGADEGPHRFIPRMLHRADLHRLLIDACQRAGVMIAPDVKVTGYTQDGDAVDISTQAGAGPRGAVVIGADGLRSVIREQMHGAAEPNNTGAVAWRALVPIGLVEDLLDGMDIAIHFGPTAHFMLYLVRQGTMLNLVGLVKTDVQAQDGWSTLSCAAELERELPGWHPRLIELLHRIPEGSLYKWPLLDRDPVARWVDGRVALLGDAAHPMVPYYGIGATIAMEDGVVLGRALAQTDDVPAALALYERARVERAALAVLKSRALGAIYMGGNALEVVTKPVMDWQIYAYDPRTAVLA